jgi:ATP-dependent Lon protease
MNQEQNEQLALEGDARSGGAKPGAGGSATALKPIPDDALIVVPVRNVVLFPGVILPVSMRREASVAAAQEAVRGERQIGFLLQRDPAVDKPAPEDLYWVGTAANVLRYLTTPDGVHHVVSQGQARFRVLQFLDGWPFMVARVQRIEDIESDSTEIEGRALQIKERAIEALQYLPQAPAELANAVRSMTSPGQLADMIVGFMDLETSEKQALLETFDLKTRLDKVLAHLARRIEVLKVSHEIDQKTKEQMEERSREVLLREQMRAIQKQLGEGDENAEELEELSKAIDEARMPEEADKQARKELKRLQRMNEAAGEYSMVRTYLDWLIELPWAKDSEDRIDIGEARRILDEDHYGLEKIKRRILEFLAVRKLNPSGKSPILCFVGPPGVGKTSLGQSIARAMGRKFVRVSLGGTHDEAEIRGHRRTYIGALPGNILQAIRKAGTRNPVMMLDEIDKLGAGGFHGDPSSALLEVLDPEQNSSFRDNYLGLPFDLSKAMFIATANMLETIPGPLRDRMEIINLPGYTQEEKLQIARRYLVQRQLEANGLRAEQIELPDETIRTIIADYTREAGVRNLEREIGSVFRHSAMRIAEGSAEKLRVDAADLGGILGPRKFENEVAMRTSVPGVATGLAWTPVGGDILFIEASRSPGSGKLILTGQLGEVMKESAQAALSLAKARAEELGVKQEVIDKHDIHVHVPAGATPKDGPSAGVAMFTALVSLLTGRAVRHDVAMTGEISLRGLVLPIGGVKEKTLAALRAGIHTVVLPERNRKDAEEIPAEAREKIRFVFVERVEEALAAAIGPELARQAEAQPA